MILQALVLVLVLDPLLVLRFLVLLVFYVALFSLLNKFIDLMPIFINTSLIYFWSRIKNYLFNLECRYSFIWYISPNIIAFKFSTSFVYTKYCFSISYFYNKSSFTV